MNALRDAAAQVAIAVGGKKKLAAMIWPGLPTAAAHKRLLDSLNENRPHKLGPDELIALGRIGRMNGVHAVASLMCDFSGYRLAGERITQAAAA
jgi:hypothetical protein